MRLAMLVGIVAWCLAASLHADEPSTSMTLDGWEPKAYRDEVRPTFNAKTSDGRWGRPALQLVADGRPGLDGWWEKSFAVEGGDWVRFSAWLSTTRVRAPRRNAVVKLQWRDKDGREPPLESDVPTAKTFAAYAPVAYTEHPLPTGEKDGEWHEIAGVYRAPPKATHVVVELHLQWVVDGQASWSDVAIEKTTAPAPRVVRLATVHHVPQGKSLEENRAEYAPLVEKAVAQRADLVVLGETLTAMGLPGKMTDYAEPVPGPTTEWFGALAKKHAVHLVVGLLERDAPAIYNTSVLLGPDGQVIGKYRKVTLPRTEIELGIAPGDDYPVFDTKLGKIGMMICYDGFFPEVARQLADRGAEVIAWPVAGCNPLLAKARACENHVFVVSSCYCGQELNWMQSAVYDREGEILARGEKWDDVAVAEVELSRPLRWASLGDFHAHMMRHKPEATPERE